MAEQDSEKSLVEQYEIGEEPVSTSSTPVETSEATTKIETPRELPPRGENGQFVKPITPDQNLTAHPAYLVRIAKQLGFTEEEIQGIPPETLGLAVAKVQETKLAERRVDSIERTQHEAASQARQSAADQPIPPQKEEPFELPIEEYDDKLVNVLKRLDRENKAMRAELNQLRNVEINRQQESLTQKMDRLFAEKKDQYGEQPGKKLAKDSPEMHRRLAVLSLMERLGPGDPEELFAKAHTAIYGTSKPAEPKPDKDLEARKKQWEEAGVSRPTHRTGAPEPNGRAKAVQSVAEAMRDLGAAGSEDSTSPDEFLGE